MPVPICMKPSMYMSLIENNTSNNSSIVARVLVATVMILLSRQSVCMCMLTGKWLSKIITVATNTRATIEEMLDTSFSIRLMSYQLVLPRTTCSIKFLCLYLTWPFMIKANSAALTQSFRDLWEMLHTAYQDDKNRD